MDKIKLKALQKIMLLILLCCFTSSAFDASNYYFNVPGLSYTQANTACQILENGEWYIAEVLTYEESLFIQSLNTTMYQYPFWIGLIRNTSFIPSSCGSAGYSICCQYCHTNESYCNECYDYLNVFYWDNSTIPFLSSYLVYQVGNLSPWGYNNSTGAAEPNDHTGTNGPQEACTEFEHGIYNTPYAWNDNPCVNVLSYLCESTPNSLIDCCGRTSFSCFKLNSVDCFEVGGFPTSIIQNQNEEISAPTTIQGDLLLNTSLQFTLNGFLNVSGCVFLGGPITLNLQYQVLNKLQNITLMHASCFIWTELNNTITLVNINKCQSIKSYSQTTERYLLSILIETNNSCDNNKVIVGSVVGVIGTLGLVIALICLIPSLRYKFLPHSQKNTSDSVTVT